MRSKKAALWQKLAKKATLQKKDNKTKEQNPGNETDCQKQKRWKIFCIAGIQKQLWIPCRRNNFWAFNIRIIIIWNKKEDCRTDYLNILNCVIYLWGCCTYLTKCLLTFSSWVSPGQHDHKVARLLVPKWYSKRIPHQTKEKKEFSGMLQDWLLNHILIWFFFINGWGEEIKKWLSYQQWCKLGRIVNTLEDKSKI